MIASGGKLATKINTTTIGDGDSIAAYLVDSAGTLLTSTLVGSAQALDVHDVYHYAEDAAHTSGDMGKLVLAVRNDADAVLTSADGDYSPFAVDSAGRLKLTISGIFAEDSAHSSGDSGMAMLGVRKDSSGSNVSADGDYANPLFYASGDMRVTDLANGSVLQQAITVGTTAVALPTTPLANRRSLFIQNSSNTQKMYIGSATVTSSGATKGIKLEKDGFVTIDAGPACLIYAIASAASGEVTVLEAA